MTTIFITGPTGTIGSKVLAALAEAPGLEIRAGVRAGEKASKLPGHAKAVEFDYDKPATMAAAFKGVEKLFLLTPFVEDPVALGVRAVEAAKAAGVKHVVKLSAFGSELEPGISLGRHHRAIEKAIEASGMAWTFLRPNNFMENFIGYYPPDAQGNIYLPWGQGACSFIDSRDVGAVGAAALMGEGHAGKAYTLTGPEAFTIGQAAATIAKVTGRTINYVDVPEEAAKSGMLAAHMPAKMVDDMMELHAIDKAGYAAVVTPTVKEVTGKEPRSFETFVRDHASAWKK